MTRTILRLLPIALGVFIGCTLGLSEDNYPERQAMAACDYTQRCMAVYFYDSYDDIDECVDEQLENWEDAEEYYEDCDFDAEKAEECIAAMALDCKSIGEDYQDVMEPCSEVWDCSDREDSGW